MKGLAGLAAVVVAGTILVSCEFTGSSTPASPSASATGSAPTVTASATWHLPGTVVPPVASPATEDENVTLLGAGDICRADYISKARATAALVKTELAANPQAIVFTLGDNSNEQGTAAQYTNCFNTTWGQFKPAIHPTPGNHDQYTAGGAAYYAYFGSAAGPSGKGYYSYEAGPYWHVIVLNAICGKVPGGCGRGSAQERWLKADLAASSGKHILAMWHAPEYSSGGHGSTTTYITWWRDLYAAHAEIVLSGHDHDYERFARQNPDGKADPQGIRQFVSGTGGAAHSPLGIRRPNSEVWNSLTYGVLQLTLKRQAYAWRFIPVAGGGFTDSGETATHS